MTIGVGARSDAVLMNVPGRAQSRAHQLTQRADGRHQTMAVVAEGPHHLSRTKVELARLHLDQMIDPVLGEWL
jgi:hypothetical protein